MTLYCAYCQRGQVVLEEVRPCQRCGSHFFTTAKPFRRRGLLTWTVDDRRFLRSLRIQSDDPIDEKPA